MNDKLYKPSAFSNKRIRHVKILKSLAECDRTRIGAL